MTRLIKTGRRKATKDHRCDGFDLIEDRFGWKELTKEKGENLPEMPHYIKAGEEYLFSTIADDNEIRMYKSCKQCSYLIHKHEIYDD